MDGSSEPPTLYVLCGLPFSGKSSLGRALAAHVGGAVVSFDALFVEHGAELGRRLEMPEVWRAIRELAGRQIEAVLRRGVSVVYDNTNFRVEHREALRSVALAAGARVVVVHVDTPLAVIAARRAANARTGERADIADADLTLVRELWQVPRAEEGAIEFRPGMDLAAWLGQFSGRGDR
jgi:predicted kinase